LCPVRSFDKVLAAHGKDLAMSRLDDLGNSAPSQPPIIGGPVPDPAPPPGPNAFTEVTIIQLYFFMWKCLAAYILFALPFWILFGIITLLFRH
jgi:hypothetical protein